MNNLDKFIDKKIISSILNEDDSTLDCYLEGFEYNVSEINTIASNNYKKETFLLKGKIKKLRDERLYEKAKMFKDAINNNIDKPVNYLLEILKNNKFQVQFRNLENLSVEEIVDIIKDQNLLEIIENLDEEE
ncbi:Mg/Co/Ni transporter MgtE [Mesonia hippocampi]|uniref:Mg/Co/Ni transporter MgtE n=1 Tax=Mesonia hippocampi TaxID=1628250 RepID=A0A840EK45_9FLAO|nr:hypothetical protein [Mesonia hippocampi]MBB4119772.1 Mg/Co/Ni transporter MgtE [Mesonia hippocampi]